MSSFKANELQRMNKANPIETESEVITSTECKYPVEIGVAITQRLINGESLNSILKDDGMPTPGAVYWWMVGGQDGGAAGVLATNYARIREAQAARLGQQAVQLVDDQAQGKGDFRTARVALDGSRWLTGRLDKSRWSDNVNVQHSGSISLDQIVQESQEKRSSVLARAQERVIEGEAVQVDDRQTESGKQADE